MIQENDTTHTGGHSCPTRPAVLNDASTVTTDKTVGISIIASSAITVITAISASTAMAASTAITAMTASSYDHPVVLP